MQIKKDLYLGLSKSKIIPGFPLIKIYLIKVIEKEGFAPLR